MPGTWGMLTSRSWYQSAPPFRLSIYLRCYERSARCVPFRASRSWVSDSRKEAKKERITFKAWCAEKGYSKASELIDEDWERMTAFFDYPKEHWQHLRTTNPVESPFAALRLRTDAARRFKKAENAIAVVWKMLLVAESRFRKLNAPELMAEVYNGTKFRDGERVVKEVEEQVEMGERAAA